MAIALTDNFIACCGFVDQATLRKNFEENEVLIKLLPVLTLGEFYTPDVENPNFLKMFIEAMFLKMDFAKEFLEDHARQLEVNILKIEENNWSQH